MTNSSQAAAAGFRIGSIRLRRLLAFSFLLCLSLAPAQPAEAAKEQIVYVLPVREDIMPPLVYLLRRGVKEAMEAKADLLVLDMETNGGRVDTTEEIIGVLGQFKGRTVTFVNRKAFSAGAFISVATQEIYMAPQSVIGAAAPILMGTGGGPESMPDTVEAKMTSGIRALVRTSAEKNGHNIEVIEAMIDKSRELKMDGEVLNEKGQILTLTNLQAEKEYGAPKQPLLSRGTVESVESLLAKLGFAKARVVRVEPTGVERFATWLTPISPLLLMIGAIGIYLELKAPGFGAPGVMGLIALTLYFLGGHVAGLSAWEWFAVFLLGLGWLFLELCVFPGTIALGVVGALLMLVSVLMALVDVYPGMPILPTLQQLRLPMQTLLIAAVGSAVLIALLARLLPATPLYRNMVSTTASGTISTGEIERAHSAQIGLTGVAVSPLRPGGKARFGELLLDVVTQGELLPKDTPVRIIAHSAAEAVVERVA